MSKTKCNLMKPTDVFLLPNSLSVKGHVKKVIKMLVMWRDNMKRGNGRKTGKYYSPCHFYISTMEEPIG